MHALPLIGWVVLGALGMSACASGPAPVPAYLQGPPTEESVPLPAGDGPLLPTLLERPCSPEGPTLEVTAVWMIPGKPPHDTFHLDVRIRNPLPRPIWVLYDLHDSLPRWVRAATLDGRGESPRRFAWQFDGGNRFISGVRVAAKADVVVRALNYSSHAEAEPLILVLATEVTIDGRPAVAWMGRQDQPLAQGEMNMQWLQYTSETKRERGWVPLGVDVVCATQVDRSGGPGKHPR